MPRKVIPTDAQIAICAATLLKRNDVVIPAEKLREMVESLPSLVLNLRHYYAGADDLDTYDRGNLGWLVAKSIGYEDWPCLGDSEEHNKEFLRVLCDAGYVPGLTREMLDLYDAGMAPAQIRAREEAARA